MSTARLDAAALAGFNGESNPHIYSAPTWYAHELGAYFRATGRPAPWDVRMGRGYSIRAREMRFRVDGGRVPTFVRVS